MQGTSLLVVVDVIRHVLAILLIFVPTRSTPHAPQREVSRLGHIKVRQSLLISFNIYNTSSVVVAEYESQLNQHRLYLKQHQKKTGPVIVSLRGWRLVTQLDMRYSCQNRNIHFAIPYRLQPTAGVPPQAAHALFHDNLVE